MTAFDHWTAMHAWWCARRTERDPIGRAWPPRSNKIEPGVEPTTKKGDATPNQPPPARPRAPVRRAKQTPPDEGGEVLASDVAALAARFDKLPDEAKAWTGGLITQGKEGFDWRIRGNPTVRRYELYRGVLQLADWANGSVDADEVVRAIVHAVTVSSPSLNDIYTIEEAVLQPTVTTGQVIGLLDYTQAVKFAEVAYDLTMDRYRLIWGDDGGARLEVVA